MRTTSPRRTRSLLAVTAASALLLAACNGADVDENGDDPDNGTEVEENGTDDNGAAEADGPVVLGILPDWTDGLSMAYLWQEMLQDQGYEVEIEEIGQAGPLYTAVASGDYHVYPSAWPEVTHIEYMETYADDLEDLGHYYEGAVLTFAVPEYTEIDSIPELAENPDMFDGQVIGIEAGAGHMNVTANEVFPTYGLDENFDLLESSTAAMLTELSSAIDANEDVVVTLWHPFWANAEYPVKDLEDPEQALGEPETLNFIANSEFSGEYPEVAEWMGNFPVLDNEQFGELEDLVVNEYEGDPAGGARAWIESNQELVDSVFN